MRCVVTGSSGLLGAEVVSQLLQEGNHGVLGLSTAPPEQHPLNALARTEEFTLAAGISFEAIGEIRKTVAAFRPEVIIHCGAISSPQICEQDPSRAQAVNHGVTATLVAIANSTGCSLLYTSTDLVFEGTSLLGRAINESDLTAPITVYARTKYAGEEEVVALGERGCIARVPLLIGQSASSSRGALGWMCQAFESGRELVLFEDEFRTPIGVVDAARYLVALAACKAQGVFHLSGGQRLSRVELGRLLARTRGYDSNLIRAAQRATGGARLFRPADVSLDGAKVLAATGINPEPIEKHVASTIN